MVKRGVFKLGRKFACPMLTNENQINVYIKQMMENKVEIIEIACRGQNSPISIFFKTGMQQGHQKRVQNGKKKKKTTKRMKMVTKVRTPELKFAQNQNVVFLNKKFEILNRFIIIFPLK